MTTSTVETIDRGLKCLSEHLGTDETELYISHHSERTFR